MPFAFSKLQPLDTGRVSDFEIPLGQYLSNSFSQGVHDSMFMSIANLEEQSLERTGNKLTAMEANDRYGLGGRLKFDGSIHESEARLLMERKEAEMRRTFYLSMGNPDGLLSKRGVAGLGASMLGNILNPLDFAINFVPVVGSEAAALRAAKMGRGVYTQALERGFIAAETLGRLPAPKLVTSLVNAGVGNVIAEVPHLISALESKEDYTIGESFLNVAAGTALGTALHLGITQAVRLYDRLTPDTKETMLSTGTQQFLEGKQIDVTKFVDIDENTIRESVRFDEALAREHALARVDIEKIKAKVKEKLNEKVIAAALRLPDGTVRTGAAHWLIDVEDLDAHTFNSLERGMVTDKGRFLSMDQAASLMGKAPRFDASGTLQFDTSEGLLMSTTDPFFLGPQDRLIFDAVKEAGATDAEAMIEVRRIQSERAEVAFFNRPDVIERIETERERRVKALVTRERNKYDAEGKFIAARDAEIQRQIREGRVLNDQQKKDWDFSKKTAEETATTVKEQIADLVKELEDEPDVKNDVAEKNLKDEHSAIDQALDCLLKNPKID